MQAETFAKLRDWVEPAHPAVIRLQSDLVTIYAAIRERFQDAIDHAFDRVSRQIGFVVTTTLPVTLKIEQKAASLEMAAPNLRGTLFEAAMMETLKPLGDAVHGNVEVGTYDLYVLWFDALKLKLHTDWMEPAHWPRHWLEPAHWRFRTPIAEALPDRLPQEAVTTAALQTKPKIGWGVPEPAHWFDPGVVIDLREALVITAIDQVYPELRLVARVENARVARAPVGPGIREPAHFRKFLEQIEPQVLQQLAEMAAAFQQGR